MEGAYLCLTNSKRLASSAKLVAESEEEYGLSIFLLIISAEEVAKGFLLAENYEQKRPINEDEWIRLTKGKAHIRKLQELRKRIKKYSGKDMFQTFDMQKTPDGNPPEKVMQRWKEYGLYIEWKQYEWSLYFEKLDSHTRIWMYNRLLEIALASIRYLDNYLNKLE